MTRLPRRNVPTNEDRGQAAKSAIDVTRPSFTVLEDGHLRRPTPVLDSGNAADYTPTTRRIHLASATIACRKWLAAGVATLVLLASSPALAVPPSEDLLPSATVGYLSVPDVKVLEEHWNQTQLGQLMKTDDMKPFGEDLSRQLKSRFTRIRDRLGLTLDDLEGVPSGELAIAVIRPAPDDAALAVLVDVTGNLEKAEALLAKIDANMAGRKATKRTDTVAGASVAVYTLPRTNEETKKQLEPATAVFFLHDNLLCGTDNLEIAEAVLRRAVGEPVDGEVLKNGNVYRQVVDRCVKDAGDLEPHVRWFLDPFGYAATVRAIETRRGSPPTKNVMEKIAGIGFSAIQGVGGFVNFYANDHYELLHRTAVYAPPAAGRADPNFKYESSARMLTFPSSAELAPQPWIPRELAAYITFNWDIKTAFDHHFALVDAYYDFKEGSWADVLKGIKTDVDGPQVDIRNEIVAHLGTRATLMTDYDIPITPMSERRLFAVESTNTASLAASIEKLMRVDPLARRKEHGQYVVWEILKEADELPEIPVVQVQLDPTIVSIPRPNMDAARSKKPNGAITVAHGALLVSSDIELLTQTLDEIEARKTLAASPDFILVSEELEKLVPGEKSFMTFARTDEEYRPTYELIREGRMPESESIFGMVLNKLFGEGDEEELRTQKIDGHNLPDFDTIRRYFGPAGLAVQTEETGWFITGFTLGK
jgi:hypothetical protein